MAVNKNHVRSISFPSRSHPSTIAIEEGLNKLLALEMWWPSTSGWICAGLSGLEDLYKCTDDLLNAGSVQQVLSQQSNRKFLEELLDASLRLMDICSASRDLMLETNEHVQAVQSGVRRRKGDLTVVASYVSFRKNMRKEARKLLASLKHMDSRIGASSPVTDQDRQLAAVVHVMKQVVSVSLSIFQSFLEFLSGPNRTRGSKWSLVLKLLQKEELARQETKKPENELESADSAIFISASSVDCSEGLQKKLEVLERTIGGFDKSLQGLLRRLIRTRASLLNILSQ